ncbi:tagatose 6-phosphate kinase [Cohnella sp. SGD-V74]|uniref:1-phosphofructokinase family hexose kinase n=1 Tax=unclassified Cohnella TaxID=2636738 RepID=UPI000D4B0DDE|nr:MULTISPECIES: 1-phosphofructokinase family hexose kinase [unclassified Cohnella]PRX66496.1 tagatose 6-phosphate kinase [Cohnella sp. SGD-V74]
MTNAKANARTMITTVTLNAAIDKTYYVPSFDKGKVSRAGKVVSTAGGKGLNVARVLQQLGHGEVAATGFAGGYNGQFITSRVKEAGIRSEFIDISGESRLCLNFIDGRDGSSTEVLEPGPEVGVEEIERFKLKLRGLSEESALVVFSGSLPRGADPGLYADLIALSRSAGADVFLDTSGESLVRGVSALPTFIKPNEDEIVSLLPDAGGADLREGIRKLMAQGIPIAAATLGPEGAVAGAGGRIYRVRIPKLEPVNTVGSGDSFVAGYAYGHVRGWPVEDCLRYAAAAGSANALSETTGDVSPAEHARLLREISVEEWTD